MRSSVVFPQPDGPTIMKNSPCPMSSDTLSTATSVPNDLTRLRMRIAGRTAGSAATGRRGEAALDIGVWFMGPRSVAKFAHAHNTAGFSLPVFAEGRGGGSRHCACGK